MSVQPESSLYCKKRFKSAFWINFSSQLVFNQESQTLSPFRNLPSSNVRLSLCSFPPRCSSSYMKMLIGLIALLLVSAQTMRAAARPHVVALGKWTTVSLPSDDRDGKTLSLKIRPLL